MPRMGHYYSIINAVLYYYNLYKDYIVLTWTCCMSGSIEETAMQLQPAEEALLRCSIQNWYHMFNKHTFKTRIVRIPGSVASWLVEDGIVLPDVERAVCERTMSKDHCMYNRMWYYFYAVSYKG